MNARKQKSLVLPMAAVAVALASFAAIPIFLSHAAPTEAPRQAIVTETVAPVPVLAGKIVFRDAKAQAQEFIGYYKTISLTPEQEAIKKAALQPMPAACCHNSSAYTCCCPCNLSKTIWGLSNLAISKYGANASDVRQVVDAWLGFTNPNGFQGTSCYQGRCEEKPSKDGCAGMNEDDLKI
jgi:hypothetical protein